MANSGITDTYDFVDIRQGRGWVATTSLVEQNNYDSIADMRTRLGVINAGYFNAAPVLNSILPASGTRSDIMTKNDLMYALRVASDSAGIR